MVLPVPLPLVATCCFLHNLHDACRILAGGVLPAVTADACLFSVAMGASWSLKLQDCSALLDVVLSPCTSSYTISGFLCSMLCPRTTVYALAILTDASFWLRCCFSDFGFFALVVGCGYLRESAQQSIIQRILARWNPSSSSGQQSCVALVCILSPNHSVAFEDVHPCSGPTPSFDTF
ncbi:hypothetical protein NEOLEDRAFT_473889 [Neolentinus lepideus HHB14362 ss-1]|uniref:Uncharacterized protein n=1 Tax=Neolentinus lepideus HHB14362 ss-1 TaxID=1314782 RepID=A0A165VJI9_9AGAM|nr:hypothetical protein NEOLEDRAFT_473889 [Neolentinus lepideus HHB14362 ss-1]